MSEPFQPVRVAYQIDDAYLLDAMRHDPTRNSPRFKRQIFIQMAAVVLFMALFSLLERRRREDLWWMPVPIALVVVFAWLYFTSPKGRLKSTRGAIQKALGAFPVGQAIEFGPDGFVICGYKGTTSFLPWQSVARAVELPEGLAICLPGGALEWITKRSFPDPESYQRVVDVIAVKVAGFERAVKFCA